MLGTVTAARLLTAWDAMLDEPVARRGAAFVASCRGLETEAVARWSIAERDSALFDLRGELFGTDAEAVTHCPACGEHLEVELDLPALRPVSPPTPRYVHSVDGYVVTARWPSTDDVVAACSSGSESAAPGALLERCVESVLSPVGHEVAFADAPDEVGMGIRDWMSMELEATEAVLELTCEVCRHVFTVPFDIATFLLCDVEAWAHRTLHDIHVLAGAHGWSESEILALSARRRQMYLDLVEMDRDG